jgi:hypothetical protein
VQIEDEKEKSGLTLMTATPQTGEQSTKRHMASTTFMASVKHPKSMTPLPSLQHQFS